MRDATGCGVLALWSQVLCACAALATVACEANTDKPNVIVIMTDDQGNNVGFQGNPHLTTPHIDRLAEQSVRLSDLDTALIGDGKDGVAYFVTVEYNGQ